MKQESCGVYDSDAGGTEGGMRNALSGQRRWAVRKPACCRLRRSWLSPLTAREFYALEGVTMKGTTNQAQLPCRRDR